MFYESVGVLCLAQRYLRLCAAANSSGKSATIRVAMLVNVQAVLLNCENQRYISLAYASESKRATRSSSRCELRIVWGACVRACMSISIRIYFHYVFLFICNVVHVKYWMRNYHFEGSFPNFPIVTVCARHTLTFRWHKMNESKILWQKSSIEKKKSICLHFPIARFYFVRVLSLSLSHALAPTKNCNAKWERVHERALVCVTSSRVFWVHIKAKIPSFRTSLRDVSWHWLCMHGHSICTGSTVFAIHRLPMMWMGAWNVCNMHADKTAAMRRQTHIPCVFV